MFIFAILTSKCNNNILININNQKNEIYINRKAYKTFCIL